MKATAMAIIGAPNATLADVERARSGLANLGDDDVGSATRKKIYDALKEAIRLQNVRRQEGLSSDPVFVAAAQSVIDENVRLVQGRAAMARQAVLQTALDNKAERERARPANWKALTDAERAGYLVKQKFGGQLGAALAELARLLSSDTSGTEVPDNFQKIDLGYGP
jgi:hypothetical protein